MADPVAVWEAGLRKIVGMGEDEIDRHLAALDRFCTAHNVTPVDVVARWQDWPELTVRRSPQSSARPDKAVESFLIHNGINVFGDLICVPRTEEGLRQQYGDF